MLNPRFIIGRLFRITERIKIHQPPWGVEAMNGQHPGTHRRKNEQSPIG
jgi:hypothetical protein